MRSSGCLEMSAQLRVEVFFAAERESSDNRFFVSVESGLYQAGVQSLLQRRNNGFVRRPQALSSSSQM
jgi:hypothetical protein